MVVFHFSLFLSDIMLANVARRALTNIPRASAAVAPRIATTNSIRPLGAMARPAVAAMTRMQQYSTAGAPKTATIQRNVLIDNP